MPVIILCPCHCIAGPRGILPTLHQLYQSYQFESAQNEFARVDHFAKSSKVLLLTYKVQRCQLSMFDLVGWTYFFMSLAPLFHLTLTYKLTTEDACYTIGLRHLEMPEISSYLIFWLLPPADIFCCKR